MSYQFKNLSFLIRYIISQSALQQNFLLRQTLLTLIDQKKNYDTNFFVISAVLIAFSHVTALSCPDYNTHEMPFSCRGSSRLRLFHLIVSYLSRSGF